MKEPLTYTEKRELAFVKRAGKIFAKAREDMLARGQSILFVRDGELISKAPNGDEKIVGQTEKAQYIKQRHFRLA